MAGGLGELRSKYLKLYASVPELLREEVIAVVDEKTYSWNAAFVEVKAETPIGDKILRALEKIGLFNR